MSIAMLARLLYAARQLTEPGEPNAEYIRGQVNLIQDAGGDSPDDHDWLYDEMTRYISHQTDSMVSILHAVEEGRES